MLGCLHHVTGFRAPATNEHRVVFERFDTAFVRQAALLDQATYRKIAELKNKRIQADYKPTHVSADELVPLALVLGPAVVAIIAHTRAATEAT